MFDQAGNLNIVFEGEILIAENFLSNLSRTGLYLKIILFHSISDCASGTNRLPESLFGGQ